MKLTDNAQLGMIVESAPIGICILDAQTLIAEMVNQKFLEIAGKPEEAIIGHWYWDSFAEARMQYEKALADVVSTKETFRAEEVTLMLIRHAHEEWVNVSFVYAPVLDDNGQVSKIAVWVLENTTQVRERIKLETARYTAEKERDRLYGFFNQAPAAICVLSGPDLIFELANPKYQALLPGRNLVGRPVFEALPELLGTRVEEVLLEVYHQGVTAEFSELLVPLAAYENGPIEDRYFTFTYVPRLNVAGQVDGVLVFAYDVTSMLLSTSRAQMANDNLEQILNMLPASVVVIRGDELLVEMINTSNLDYWQKSKEEVVGRPFLEILPDLANQPFANQLRHVMATGETIDVKESPVFFTLEDGTIRETYVDYTYQALSDLNGIRNGVLVMSFEITDRVRSKRLLEQYADELAAINVQLSVVNDSLAKSEARFKFLIQEAPVAIGVLHGRNFLIESANDKLLEVWGKSQAVIGLPLVAALPEISNQPFQGILEKVFDTGEAFYANEIRALLEHAGELKEIFFNLVYQPVADASGQVADILIVAVDVTQQVNSRKAVEQSEAHFRKLADLVPAKISNALPNGEVTFFNQQWLDFAGMGFEDLRDFGYHQMMHPDEFSAFQTGLHAAAQSGIPYVSEMRFKNTEGKYIWHLNIASPILDEENKLIMWVGSTTDIQVLKEEEQRKNDFIGMVSHELKTPLTSLNGYLQLLKSQASKSEIQNPVGQRFLDQSLKQTAKMTTMINGFLNVTRLESGQMLIEKTSVNMASLLEEAELEARHTNTAHEISFEPVQVQILADRDKIVQVINNLISNAVKYSKPGTAIHVSGKVENNSVRIAVRDQGMGISDKDLDQVFKRFYRVENQSNISGFGIGLYLCAEIIRRHEGKIWAESEQGKGSVFYFSLPLEPQPIYHPDSA